MRSRLYDEQIRQLIQDVGLDRISQRVVNSSERPPEFYPPDFSLPHLIEVGNELVQEQRQVQEMRLAEEYNKSLYFNRKLGDTVNPGLPKSETIHDRDFFRAYNPDSDNGNPPPPTPSNPMSYAGQASTTNLTPEMMSEINRILGQGYRLAIETVDERRFRTGSWNCYGSYEEMARSRSRL